MTNGQGVGIPLHRYVIRLIWLSILPMLLVAGGLAVDSVRTQQAEIDQEAGALTQTIATAVDQRLLARSSALHVMSVSHHLTDAALFKHLYEEGLGYYEQFGSHVILAEVGEPMRALFNTRVPFGTLLQALPRPAGHAAAPAALASGLPAVGDVFPGRLANEPMVAIAVPVKRAGKTPYLLLAVTETRKFREHLDQVALPQGYTLALLDGSGTEIARRVPAGFDPVRDADAAGRFVAKSGMSPWSVVLEIPRKAYRAPLITAATGLGLTLLAAILAGAVVARLGSRRLAGAVSSLAGPPAADAAPQPAIAEISAARLRLDQSAMVVAASLLALRDSERRFRTLFEEAPLGINIVGKDEISLHANRALQDLLGYSEDELHGISFSDWTHPEDRALSLRALQQLSTRGADRLEVEKRYLRKDGSVVWARVHLAVVRVEDGEPDFYIAMIEDITEPRRVASILYQTEARLHALAARLQAVREEERTRLAREVHDELGQALTGLSMDLAWLRARLARIDDAELRQSVTGKLGEIDALAASMVGTVQEIASELRPGVLDNLGLVAAIRFEAARFLRRTGIACTVDVPEEAMLLDDGKATGLFRVLQEILVNVFRHAAATRVGIRLAASEGVVLLEVRDNGCGITAEDIDAAGSLGLLGMRERLAAIGGRIDFSGEAGRGTTVTATVRQ